MQVHEGSGQIEDQGGEDEDIVVSLCFRKLCYNRFIYYDGIFYSLQRGFQNVLTSMATDDKIYDSVMSKTWIKDCEWQDEGML